MPKRSPSKKPAKKKTSKGQSRGFRIPRPSLGLLVKLAIVGVVLFTMLAVYCDAQVRGAFDAQRYDQPAKVYARPLVLASGAILTSYELEEALQQLGYQPRRLLNAPGSYNRSGDQFTIFLRPFHFADGLRPAQKIEVSMGPTTCLLYTSPSPRDRTRSRMPSSA